MRIYSCLTEDHNLWLVLAAAAICTLGSWVVVRLFRRARDHSLGARAAWIFLGAVASGSTVWCTHFVAMLAYHPGAPIAFKIGLTGASLVVAIVASGIGLALACGRFRFAPELGGAVFGVGVAAMHYTGMAGLAVEGIVTWDPVYIAASCAFSVVFSAIAFSRADASQNHKQKAVAAAILVLAIVSLHFTGMSAISVLPFDAAPPITAGREALALSVAGIGLLVLGTGAVSYVLDRDSQSQAAARLRHLTESAVDGMVVEREGAIVELNAAFEDLTGRTRAEMLGRSVAEFVEDGDQIHEGELLNARLSNPFGDPIPVEVVARSETLRAGAPGIVVYAIRDLRARIAQERRIDFLARFDSLTGLQNRPAFLEKLETWTAACDLGVGEACGGDRVALLAIDLDGFKDVNDIHGHAAGDHVLRTLARRMLDALKDGEQIARIGGDEFVAVVRVNARDDARSEARDLADRLAAELRRPVPFDESELRCGGSIGVALYPDDASAITTLMNNADLAMYRAKGSQDESLCFYDASMDEIVRIRSRTAKDLREALAKEQFTLNFQVQMSAADQKITGYEALIRWNHPERGWISPADFIPVAEETGLIGPIGEWVLRTACAEAVSWCEPHKVAVNLSAVQLVDAKLPDLVAEALAETGLAPSLLEVEVTETSLIRDRDRASSVLRRIKELGVSVAIDDFGTGYSSLSMLQAFPFDKIKLDKSFLDQLDENEQSRAILDAVLSLGGSLRIPILAEGVETNEQLEFLRARGCNEAQGYLLGRPVPSDQIAKTTVAKRSA